MHGDVVISQTTGGVGLRFFDVESEPSGALQYFSVEVRAPNVFAKVLVYADGHHGLVRLFQEMARDWKGWQGEKAWESLEGEMSLKCASDHLGHITLLVGLRESSAPSGWNMTARVCLEAGQLDSVASAVARFFGGDGQAR